MRYLERPDETMVRDHSVWWGVDGMQLVDINGELHIWIWLLDDVSPAIRPVFLGIPCSRPPVMTIIRGEACAVRGLQHRTGIQ